MSEAKVKPVSMKQAIYRSINDDQWYWWQEGFAMGGPFRTREEARNDFRHKTERTDDNNSK